MMTTWGEDAPLLAVVIPDTTRTDMRLVGELDLATVPVLATLIEQQMATGHLEVRLDLSELSFCDVRGLRGLLDARRRLASAGGRLVFVGPRPLLSRVAVIGGVALELGWLVEPGTPWPGDTTDTAGASTPGGLAALLDVDVRVGLEPDDLAGRVGPHPPA